MTTVYDLTKEHIGQRIGLRGLVDELENVEFSDYSDIAGDNYTANVNVTLKGAILFDVKPDEVVTLDPIQGYANVYSQSGEAVIAGPVFEKRERAEEVSLVGDRTATVTF